MRRGQPISCNLAPYGLRGAVKITLIYFTTITSASLAMSYNLSITRLLRLACLPTDRGTGWSVPSFALALSFTIPAMW